MMRVVPGEAPTILAASTAWIGTGWIAVDPTHVYFSACPTGACETTSLYRIARGGAPYATKLIDLPMANDFKIAVASGRIQWGWNELVLSSAQPLAYEARQLFDEGYPIAVAATPDALYFADFYTGAIFSSRD